MARVFSLGNFSFSISATDASATRLLSKVFPPGLPSNHATPEVFIWDETRSLSDFIADIIEVALASHHGCLWVDAASIVTADGRVIMVAGDSGAGKTTLSLALDLSQEARILSDDITLIDPERMELVSFPAPFCVRPGTPELVSRATGKTVKLILGRWVAKQSFVTSPARACFDEAFLLSGQPEDTGLPMEICRISSRGFVRQVLSLSNALRSVDGPDKLADSLKGAKCAVLTGGSLAERIMAISRADSIREASSNGVNITENC